jgi:GlpG protein
VRLIGTIKNEQEGLAFSRFLLSKEIKHRLEVQENLDWGSPDYGIHECKVWIEDEDQVAEAVQDYNLFQENPLNPIFTSPAANLLTPPPPRLIKDTTFVRPAVVETSKQSKSPKGSITTLWERQPMGPITRFFLFICSILFIIGELIPSAKKGPDGKEISTFFSSPIAKVMLYDFPHFYELLDKFLHLYGYEALDHPSQLSTEGKEFYSIMTKTPYWKGFYSMAIEDGSASLFNWKSYPPLFEKIREGQIWRIFSPALLHADIFHLFFNMLWLIVLGKQIEQRLKLVPYILLILLLGIFSNTAQYLMSGPNFLGFSGILCGMLAFIWVRQRQTPWEGYLLDKSTFLFMTVFVLGMASMQLVSFVFENSMNIGNFAPNIANTAHISGALGGFILGKFNFFSWRRAA